MFESYIEKLEEVLRWLRGTELKLKPSKCEIQRKKVKYLGHIVSKQGVAIVLDKAKPVKDWKKPENVIDRQAFLGVAAYYQH